MFEHQLILLNCEKIKCSEKVKEGGGSKITILPFLFTCGTVIKMTTSRNPDSPVLEYDVWSIRTFSHFPIFLLFLKIFGFSCLFFYFSFV